MANGRRNLIAIGRGCKQNLGQRRPPRRASVRPRELRIEVLENRLMLANPTAVGPEFLVDTYTTGPQAEAVVAADSTGDFVVAWEGAGGGGYGIYAQRYSAAGAARGSQFEVNSNALVGTKPSPKVAMDSAGDFVIVWRNYSDGSGYGIFAQRFNASGTTQGSEFLVNAYTTGNQIDPAVAMDATGDFVVAWDNYTTTSNANFGATAQRYNSSGVAQGSQFSVSTASTGIQSQPTVAMDATGEFVLAWNYNDQHGNVGVAAERYNLSGVAQGSQFVIASPSGAPLNNPAVAMDSAGDFVIATLGYDGGGYGVYVDRYNASGVAPGSTFLVNTYTMGNQGAASEGPSVAMDSEGDFVVAWESYGEDGSDFGIYAQSYSSSGAVLGSEFRVNTYTTGAQTGPSVDMDSAGDFVVAWNSQGQEGSGSGVYAQRYGSGILTINGTSASNNVTITFTDAADFTITLNGGTPTAYSTASVSKLIYNGPSGMFSKLVFDDPFNTYAAMQSFTATDLVSTGFEFDANNVLNLYDYATNGASTATVSVGTGTDSNFFVDVPGSSYSYIGNPATGAYSELSGFASEAVSGSSGSTYAYFYSTSHATVVGNTTASSATVDGHTSTFGDFSQLYVVGASDGTDSVTLDSLGGTFVGTPGFSYVSGTSGGSSFLIGALFAASVTAQASGSADTAVFYSYASNTFSGAPSSSFLTGSTANAGGSSYNFVTTADGYGGVTVFESGAGSDVANLSSPGNGKLIGTSTVSTLTVGASTITVNTYFENSSSQIAAVPSQVAANGIGNGTDTASIYDAAGSNALVASGSTATLTTSVDTIAVNKFGSVTAYQQNGSGDTVRKAAIDFTLATVGNWTSV